MTKLNSEYLDMVSFIKKELKILHNNKNINVHLSYFNDLMINCYIDKMLKEIDLLYIERRLKQRYNINSMNYYFADYGTKLEINIKNKNQIRTDKIKSLCL